MNNFTSLQATWLPHLHLQPADHLGSANHDHPIRDGDHDRVHRDGGDHVHPHHTS